MRKQDKYAYVGLFALTILGMAIGFLANSTIDPLYDDVTYITYAHQMLAGNFNFDYSPFAISIGLIIPIAVSFKLLE